MQSANNLSKSSQSKKLSEQDINIYRLMFEKIDSDKSGTIDRTELFSMMKELTEGKISETDVDAMMKGKLYSSLNMKIII